MSPGPIAPYDGWNFLRLRLPVPIPPDQPVTLWMRPQWLNTAPTAAAGDLRVDCPIQLTAVVVVLNRIVPYLDQTIRLKDVRIRVQNLSAEY